MPVHPVLSLDRQGIIEAMENKEVSTWCLFEMVSGSRACGNNQARFRSLITWEGWFCHLFIYRVFSVSEITCHYSRWMVIDFGEFYGVDFFFFHKSGLGDYHILSKIVSSLLLYSVY